jgi:hypothetical protein
MCVNHHDKCWWKAFCQDVKRAFKKNDFQMKVELFKQYQRHMDARTWREYYYFKRLDFQELKEKGLVDERADFYDWLKKNPC